MGYADPQRATRALRFRAPHARAVLFALAATGCAAQAVPAQTHTSQHHAFRTVNVVEGLEHPWGMAFLPDGDILVTERPGRLRIVRDGALSPDPITGVPDVHARGQGGLLDVAIHPDFAENRFVYLSYSKPGPDRTATTAVIRGRLEGNALTGVEEIIEAKAWRQAGQHFGSRLVFDRDGYLYITVGERGEMQAAQDLTNHQGTVLRLHDDGRVPEDNPFVGRSDALPEIYTYGNRSPQGLTVHPATGELWESEHGPRGGDEINLIRPGANYGWPVITYGINYNGRPISDIQEKEGMEQPLHNWVPSIATSGIAIYDGDRFPNWRGDVFVGGLAGQHLARVRFDSDRNVIETEKLLEGIGRVRDVRTGPDGSIYLLIDAPDAPLVRLDPAG
ncbi:MAG TPA: PQQ-dependent sugar dehydrogenase [Longimicrobiales bacterium]|nr:PQQ-dependent sugar dehydrogenase [Longimicrobiales bacterium]